MARITILYKILLAIYLLWALIGGLSDQDWPRFLFGCLNTYIIILYIAKG